MSAKEVGFGLTDVEDIVANILDWSEANVGKAPAVLAAIQAALAALEAGDPAGVLSALAQLLGLMGPQTAVALATPHSDKAALEMRCKAVVGANGQIIAAIIAAIQKAGGLINIIKLIISLFPAKPAGG